MIIDYEKRVLDPVTDANIRAAEAYSRAETANYTARCAESEWVPLPLLVDAIAHRYSSGGRVTDAVEAAAKAAKKAANLSDRALKAAEKSFSESHKAEEAVRAVAKRLHRGKWNENCQIGR